MANSGLIVLLPLVGAILGAIVGAVGGAWANNWYRDREAKKAEDREREGLLRLIDSEILFNGPFFRQFRDDPSFLTPHVADTLRTESWNNTNARLGQLLPADHMRILSGYYFHIYMTKTVVKDERVDNSVVVNQLNTILRDGGSARKYGQRYLKDPDYTEEATLEAQSQSSETGHREDADNADSS